MSDPRHAAWRKHIEAQERDPNAVIAYVKRAHDPLGAYLWLLSAAAGRLLEEVNRAPAGMIAAGRADAVREMAQDLFHICWDHHQIDLPGPDLERRLAHLSPAQIHEAAFAVLEIDGRSAALSRRGEVLRAQIEVFGTLRDAHGAESVSGRLMEEMRRQAEQAVSATVSQPPGRLANRYKPGPRR